MRLIGLDRSKSDCTIPHYLHKILPWMYTYWVAAILLWCDSIPFGSVGEYSIMWISQVACIPLSWHPSSWPCMSQVGKTHLSSPAHLMEVFSDIPQQYMIVPWERSYDIVGCLCEVRAVLPMKQYLHWVCWMACNYLHTIPVIQSTTYIFKFIVISRCVSVRGWSF